MLKNCRVSTRLGITFGAIILVMIIVCGLFYISFERVTSVSKWNVHSYQVVDDMRSVTENLVNMETGLRGFALIGRDDMLQPFTEGDRAFNRYLTNIKELTSDNAEQQKRLEALAAMENQWKNHYAMPIINARQGVNKGNEDMDQFITRLMADTGKAQMDAMRKLLTSAIDDEYRLMAERQNELSAERTKTQIIIIIGVIAVIVIAMAMGTLLARSISRPLNQAVKTADTIAAGDLTSVIHITSKDETGMLLTALDNMQVNLRELVAQIKESAASVDLASSEIEQGNMELSSRTEEQAAALQQTAASMEQLTTTVRNNTSVAENTAASARSTESLARQGEIAVSEMSETMQSISANAVKIKEITSVIGSIAFQTNILALNAAVEAARAGEHGRGFAVVAAEVRNLAQKSAEASREIGTLIEEAVNSVEEGVVVANSTVESILRTASEVAVLAQSMDSIALASVEQMQGILQIGTAVNQMDSVTQGNAALVEQSAAASQSLTEQSRALRAMTDTFQI